MYDPASGATRASRASTAYGPKPAELFLNNDGYAEGYLRGLTVGQDGVMTGSYSNGQTLDLARITLYRFTSQDGLHREGSNRFSATRDPGGVQEGIPGTEHCGKVAGENLAKCNGD